MKEVLLLAGYLRKRPLQLNCLHLNTHERVEGGGACSRNRKRAKPESTRTDTRVNCRTRWWRWYMSSAESKGRGGTYSGTFVSGSEAATQENWVLRYGAEGEESECVSKLRMH